MKNFFPAKNQSFTYLQTNRSDTLGSLWSTMNLDFQNDLGTMQAASRLRINTSTVDSALMTTAPQAFANFNSTFFTISGTRVFKNSTVTPDSAFTVDASTNFQTTYSLLSDLEMFNSQLFSTTADEIWSLSDPGGGTWTRRGGANPLGSNGFHQLTYFKKFDRLYVTATGDKIYSLSTGYALATSGDYALDLNTNQQIQITSVVAGSQSLWVGVIDFLDQTGRGKIYEWDGISAQPTNEYLLDSTGCLALTIDNDIPYAVDTNGALLKFTGSSFEEIARLPNATGLDVIDTLNVNGFIHPNGLLPTKNNTILILVTNKGQASDLPISENFPSGVWEYSEDFGLTHKYAITYNRLDSSTITDYGQNRIINPGAIANANGLFGNSTGKNAQILVGANFRTSGAASGNTRAAILLDDRTNAIQKKSYFVTTWFTSEEVEDKWLRLWAVFKRFLSSTDTIVFKYRLYEEDPVDAIITWTSTTTFTTTTDISAYGPTATGFNGTIGGEVEGIQGIGSGQCVHITAISLNAGTYTATIDTAVTGATSTCRARFQKWIKLLPEITGQVKSWSQLAIGASNPRIQIKGCLTFTDSEQSINEFEKMAIFSNEDIKITA